jgi:hypothetical protein
VQEDKQTDKNKIKANKTIPFFENKLFFIISFPPFLNKNLRQHTFLKLFVYTQQTTSL